ncbi:MAG TPA: putative glycolipid-binding domain-containing protein [Streptosporangiaceae bacterium]
MSFASLPREAAWQHQGARSGFEVVFFCDQDGGCLIQGCTTAVEDGMPWAVEYAIELDGAGATRSARINGRSAAGSCSTVLEADGAGRWLVNGEDAPQLDGCLDVDLESSAMTNALPVRRLGLAVAARAAAPAAYVRAVGQPWTGSAGVPATPDEAAHQCYDYTAPALISSAAWLVTSPAW